MSAIKIPVYRPSLTGHELLYVQQAIQSTWISSKGEFIDRFEAGFTELLGGNVKSTSVCNGTVALHLALAALGIGPGDEVIVPAFTYVASVNAISYVGAKPVFIDSREDTLQLDEKLVAAAITPKTKAIMAVHLYGHPCELNALVELCKKRKIFLIEDCAEAIGTTYDGVPVGTFGDIATFSFFGNKTITTGEGGMVVSRNSEIWSRAAHLKNQGVSPTKQYWHDSIGFNFRMTNVCAAIGVAQLEKANTFIKQKRELAHKYQDNLSGLPLKLHLGTRPDEHSYWMVSAMLRSPTERDQVRSHLLRLGIETRPFFYPAHVLPMYQGSKSFPVAEDIAARGINLPSWPDLSSAEIKTVCEALHSYNWK